MTEQKNHYLRRLEGALTRPAYFFKSIDGEPVTFAAFFLLINSFILSLIGTLVMFLDPHLGLQFRSADVLFGLLIFISLFIGIFAVVLVITSLLHFFAIRARIIGLFLPHFRDFC